MKSHPAFSAKAVSRAAAAVTLLAALAGCMAGPDYTGPPDAAPAAGRAASFRRAASAPGAVTSALPLAPWWTVLDDPILDRIENEALRASPTLAAAEARVRNARATVGERETDLLPAGGADAGYDRVLVPSQLGSVLGGQPAAGVPGLAGAAPSSKPLNLYETVLDASWQIDIFGGTRRKIESARATADYQQAELEDARVTLTGDVARAYVNLRDRQHRLALARENTATEQKMVDLVRMRRTGGTASGLEVLRQETQRIRTEAQIPTLAGETEIYSDQLAQLAGQEPGSFATLLAAPGPIPLPPAQTAIGDPASMLRHRPDIRAAERQIAASNAMIGANIAQYFPQVTLLGTIGYTGTDASKLFTGSALTYLGGPSISWSVFDIPKIHSQVAEARADTAQARAAYSRTVLSALLDAENALSRFGHQRDDVAVLAEAETVARNAAALSKLRLAGGTSSLIDALDVERQRTETQTDLAQGQAQLTSDWVALQGSLGLGWDDGALVRGKPRGFVTLPASLPAVHPGPMMQPREIKGTT